MSYRTVGSSPAQNAARLFGNAARAAARAAEDGSTAVALVAHQVPSIRKCPDAIRPVFWSRAPGSAAEPADRTGSVTAPTRTHPAMRGCVPGTRSSSSTVRGKVGLRRSQPETASVVHLGCSSDALPTSPEFHMPTSSPLMRSRSAQRFTPTPSAVANDVGCTNAADTLLTMTDALLPGGDAPDRSLIPMSEFHAAREADADKPRASIS